MLCVGLSLMDYHKHTSKTGEQIQNGNYKQEEDILYRTNISLLSHRLRIAPLVLAP